MKRVRGLRSGISLLRRCLLEDAFSAISVIPKQSFHQENGSQSALEKSRTLFLPLKTSTRASCLNTLDLLSIRHFSAQPMLDRKPEESTESDDKDHSAVESSLKAVTASALDVDKALEDYDKVLDKHRDRYLSRQQTTLFSKAVEYLQITWKFTISAWNFILGLPETLYKATMAPWSVKKTWMVIQWKHLKEGTHHYWVGTKLLAMDIRVASRLVFKVLRGRELTRREMKQLSRTVADLFRMVPMIIFLLIPFLEFLLPVAIRLFPNMLPSTFEDKLKKEEELKKRLTAKLEVAQFLQDTVAVMARDLKQRKTGEAQASASELFQFMKDIRRGVSVHNDDIIRFAKLFGDEFTLDNLSRVHLTSMCQLVGISPFGTDSFLRTRLHAHLGGIKRDDLVIREEGLDTLTTEELRSACRARAMRALYGEGAREYMKQHMEEWLELSLDRHLPSSLLLLSRAFTVTQPIRDRLRKPEVDLTDLAKTLSTLPDETVEDVEVALSDQAVTENEKKLEYIKREEDRIREEELEREAQRKAEIVDQETVQKEKEYAQDMAATATAAAVFQAAEASAVKDALQSQTEESAEEISAKLTFNREQKLKKVLSALAVLTSSSGVCTERSKFMKLVQKEIDRLQGEMNETGGASLRFSRHGFEAWRPAELPDIPEDYVSKRLQDRVAKIMHNIEHEMDEVDAQIGEKLHLVDLDGDGMISKQELQSALGYLKEQMGEAELKHLLEELGNAAQDDSFINVNQLMELANERLSQEEQQKN